MQWFKRIVVVLTLLFAGCGRGEDERIEATREWLASRSIEAAGVRICRSDETYAVAEALIDDDKASYVVLTREDGNWRVARDLEQDFASRVFEAGEGEIADRLYRTVAETEGKDIKISEGATKRFRMLGLDNSRPAAEIEIEFSCNIGKLGQVRKGVFSEHYFYEHPQWRREGSRIFYRVN